MFDNEMLGNTLENWGISVLIIIGTMLIAKLVSLFNKKVVKRITEKTVNRLDDIIYKAIESPVLFAIMLAGIWIAFYRLDFSESFNKGISTSYRILVVLNVTWFFTRLINSLIEVYWANNSDDSVRTRKHTSRMMPVVKRSILVIVWCIGIVMALSNVGVNITALLGTLGIGGIAFALAAQDTIKNIFGAFTIFTDKPFSIGDTVRIDQLEGTIVDVGIRSTKIRNYDKRLITLPNYKVADASIINITAEPMRRVVLKLGLTYATTPEKMEEAMNILRAIPDKVEYITSKDLTANFTDFLDSALVITFIYFIQKRGDIAKVTSNVNMEILKAFNAAGIEFAFPTQTLYISKDTTEEI